MEIKTIHASGSPFTVGYQHGAGAAKEIDATYKYYMTSWRSQSGIEEKEILEKANAFLPFIENLDGRFVDELKGIAKGSSLEFSKILALNCRWELNYEYLADMNEANGGCTAFAMIPEATKNHHTYVGQNWDYKPPLNGLSILLKIEQPDRPSLTMITEAGIIGHKGFSSSGIGLCVNFIKLDTDTFTPGIPFFIKMRYLLEQPTIDACLNFLRKNTGPNSGNILIASREGIAADIECNPKGMNIIHPTKGILVHSNHFQILPDRNKDIGCMLLPDTFNRTNRLGKHLVECKAITTSEAIEIGLRDHSGLPNSICRHPDESTAVESRWETLISFYVDLDEENLKFTVGSPCLSTFTSCVPSKKVAP